MMSLDPYFIYNTNGANMCKMNLSVFNFRYKDDFMNAYVGRRNKYIWELKLSYIETHFEQVQIKLRSALDYNE